MSHVYYKFKSQKDPSRVIFDGPSISVFDLKREIILLNKLGNGADFDLSIYDESTNEGNTNDSGKGFNGIEYTDDNEMIPRATSIIARRLPPSKPGKGNGAKYVSGSAVPSSRNSRNENFGKRTNQVTAKSSSSIVPMVISSIPGLAHEQPVPSSADNESAAIAMMMSAQSANWDSTQEKMAMANPIYYKHKKPLAAVPDKPPPTGYICHRCGNKGHWIQACPTNEDPNFDNKPRIKRTTGIPKTFLKKADKPVFDDDGEGKTNGVMVNADGEYVIVEPDSKSWATYQAKANASEGDIYSQPLPAEHSDWECQICGKMAKDATRTPCCKKVFCDECIQSALLESDFVCPGCGTNEILLDSLVLDQDMRLEIAEYVKNWEEGRKSASPPAEIKNVSTKIAKRQTNRQEMSPPPSRKRSRSPSLIDETSNKKLITEESSSSASKSTLLPKSPATAPTVPTGPSNQLQQQQQHQQQHQYQQQQQFNSMPPFMPGMPMPGMPFPPFPPDPFMMAAMGLGPPILGMMPMPPMGPGMFPQQGYNQQMGNQMYGGDRSAYMRRPVNDRGMRRAQRGSGGHGRSQEDYKEII